MYGHMVVPWYKGAKENVYKKLQKLFIEKKKQKYENERARNREIIEY